MRSFSVAISSLRNAKRLAHADDLVGGERAGAHAALVAAAVHLRFEPDARLAPHVQGTHAFGAVSLVGGERHQVDLELLQVDHHLAGGLGRIDMKDDPSLAADFAQFLDVLDDAYFVVDEHDGRQDGVRADGSLEFFQIEQAVGFRLQIGDLEALPLQFAHRVDHGLVFGQAGDEVFALALVELGGTLDREVVGFGRAGSPDDLLGIGIDQGRNVRARFLHRLFRLPAERMAA